MGGALGVLGLRWFRCLRHAYRQSEISISPILLLHECILLLQVLLTLHVVGLNACLAVAHFVYVILSNAIVASIRE